MARLEIVLEDLDNGKYRVECTPDINSVAQKHMNGYQLTSAESKTLLAMAAIKKVIIEESILEEKSRSPIIL